MHRGRNNREPSRYDDEQQNEASRRRRGPGDSESRRYDNGRNQAPRHRGGPGNRDSNQHGNGQDQAPYRRYGPENRVASRQDDGQGQALGRRGDSGNTESNRVGHGQDQDSRCRGYLFPSRCSIPLEVRRNMTQEEVRRLWHDRYGTDEEATGSSDDSDEQDQLPRYRSGQGSSYTSHREADHARYHRDDRDCPGWSAPSMSSDDSDDGYHSARSYHQDRAHRSYDGNGSSARNRTQEPGGQMSRYGAEPSRSSCRSRGRGRSRSLSSTPPLEEPHLRIGYRPAAHPFRHFARCPSRVGLARTARQIERLTRQARRPEGGPRDNDANY